MTNAKLLIVGDAAYLEEPLRGLGYAVCAKVPFAWGAIEEAAGMGPDLALVDIGAEGGADGLEAADRIGSRLGIPVLLLADGAAETGQGMFERAWTASPFGYVLKPFGERQLHWNIEAALALHGRERGHREAERGLEGAVAELQERVELMQAVLAAWQTLLEAARFVRYYDALAKRYSTYELCLSFVLGVSGAGAVLSVVDIFVVDPAPWMRVWGAGMVVVILVNFIAKPSARAALLAVARERLSQQEVRARNLWLNIDTPDMDDEKARQELTEIVQTMSLDVQLSSGVPTAHKLNQRCTEETYTAEALRYAA